MQNSPLMQAAIAALLLIGMACGGPDETPFLERWEGFETKLTTEAPAPIDAISPEVYPGDWKIPPERINEITYHSGDLELRALVYIPEEAADERRPALVYLHGGLQLHEGALRNCKPFLDAGFVVMAPGFRGEAGNPGNFEMWMGDVGDAKAAVQWLAEQPYVDADRIYAIGWSYGGGVATLLTLMEDVPVKHSASAGGLLGHDFIDSYEGLVPFDTTDPEEVELRFLLGNIRWMKHRHYAYVGSADQMLVGSIEAARREIGDGESQLEIRMVAGDHLSAFPTALELYLELIESESAN